MYEGNILFVKDGSPEGNASSKWLCEWPAQALIDAGYFVSTMNYQDVPTISKQQQRDVDQAHVIVYERHVDDPWLPFLERCAKEKRLFITLDDAYWCVDPSTPTYGFWSQNDRLQKLEDICSKAEGVITPSERLSAHFTNGIFKPNRPNFNDPAWAISPLFSDNVIMWGGTAGHIDGLRGHPCLEAVQNLGDDIQFVAISGSPDIMTILEEYGAQAIPGTPYHEWLRVIGGSTVVICPLGSEYDEHRSWIKALEAAATGVVWVASNRGVYNDVEGGILVEDTVEAWEQGIIYAMEQRDELGEHGRLWAWKQGVHDHLDEWEAIFDA